MLELLYDAFQVRISHDDQARARLLQIREIKSELWVEGKVSA